MNKSKKQAVQVIKNKDGSTKVINHNAARAGMYSKKTTKRYRSKSYV